MIEAKAHNFIKSILKKDALLWPHNLTLSRLIARSLRRRDKSIFQLEISNPNDYWLGLLLPLCLNPYDVVLVVGQHQKRRLLQVEIPRLEDEGFILPIWEGEELPMHGQIWLLNHHEFFIAYRNNLLDSKQIIISEAELFSIKLRDAMAIKVYSSNWDSLSRAYPSASTALITFYETLNRKLFSRAIKPDSLVRINLEDTLPLFDLLSVFGQLPSPWNYILEAKHLGWASWAEFDHTLLDWIWHMKPLEPIQDMHELFINNPFIMISGSLQNEFEPIKDLVNVNVKLGGPIHKEPVDLFVPFRQPLPNAECFAEHLLDQCRRLVLGRGGLTIIILDDEQLLRQLTSGLAAEFGKRVVFNSTGPEVNGIICCSSSWWIASQSQLPSPEQLIIALLPFSSLETPITAARVESFKKQGLDWFRKLLLPELLSILPRLVMPIRKNHGRIAILDGRLRSRAWGKKIFDVLEPWIPLDRLLPD